MYARKTQLCARAHTQISEVPRSHLDGMFRAVRLKEERTRFIVYIHKSSLPLLHTLFLPSTLQLPRIARDARFYVLDLGETGCFSSHLRQSESLREIMDRKNLIQIQKRKKNINNKK